MTIPVKLYTDINNKLVAILDSYKNELSQYDVLVIATNLLVSYMEVLVKIDLIPKDKIFDDVVQLMKQSFDKSFVSKN